VTRPKATVRRDPDSGQWVATRPRLGFSEPESKTFPTQQAALKWLDGNITRQGTLSSQVEGKGHSPTVMKVDMVGSYNRPWYQIPW
jgi:hypothetical protein